MSALSDIVAKTDIADVDKREVETEPNPEAVAPQTDAGDGVATPADNVDGMDGNKSAEATAKASATTDGESNAKESLPKAEETATDTGKQDAKVDKSKLTRAEKADYAWKKLTHKNSVQAKKIKELEDQLAQAQEVAKHYKEKGDFANYMELHDSTKVLEQYKRELEDDLNSNPTELREAQAESIWDAEDPYDAKILDTYRNIIMPRSGQLMKDVYGYVSANVNEDVAKNVVDYIKNSDNNPVLELALSTRDIQMKVLNSMCRSTDPRKIWLDCSKVENDLIKQLADFKAKSLASTATQPKTSSRSTGSIVSGQHAKSRDINIHELSDAEMDALLSGKR